MTSLSYELPAAYYAVASTARTDLVRASPPFPNLRYHFTLGHPRHLADTRTVVEDGFSSNTITPRAAPRLPKSLLALMSTGS